MSTACTNCSISFVADGGQPCTVSFPLGAGTVHYQVCSECGRRAQSEGARGIPSVLADARVSPNAMRTLKLIVN